MISVHVPGANTIAGAKLDDKVDDPDFDEHKCRHRDPENRVENRVNLRSECGDAWGQPPASAHWRVREPQTAGKHEQTAEQSESKSAKIQGPLFLREENLATIERVAGQTASQKRGVRFNRHAALLMLSVISTANYFAAAAGEAAAAAPPRLND